jgi:hypothetical protein
VAAEGATVAVKVTLAPKLGVVVEAESMVVVAVEPEEVLTTKVTAEDVEVE